MILGTASYMAPEQARGRVVDKRADVWAFGVVLYEMLTGTRAFPGDDVSDTLATVLKFDPDWNRLPTDTPPSIRRLLKRCLTKDPKLRLRECGSALLDIHEALASPERVEAPLASIGAKLSRPLRRWALIAAAALVLGAVVGAVAGQVPRSRRQRSATTTDAPRFMLPEGDVLPAARGTLLAISLDGRTLVYQARRGTAVHLFRRAIDQFDATIIPGTERGSSPFVSVDGVWIGFIERSVTDWTVKKVPISGGQAQPLATARSMWGAAWAKDSRIIWAEDDGNLKSVPDAGGESTPLFKADDRVAVFSPQLLPNNSLLLTTWPAGRYRATGRLPWSIGARGRRKRSSPTPGPDAFFLQAISSSCEILHFGRCRSIPIGSRLLARPCPSSKACASSPVGPLNLRSPTMAPWRMFLERCRAMRPLDFVGRDGGQPEALKIPARDYLNVALSPDQTRVAAQIDDGDDADVWVAEIARRWRPPGDRRPAPPQLRPAVHHAARDAGLPDDADLPDRVPSTTTASRP